ncbi:MAG: hypothetical protein ACOZB0_08655 [Pseudomonadota bacterium]
MNVFVLNAGRSGSSTFIAACRPIENFSAGHETRARLVGPQRLAYPARHIEADNRLSWLLGRLDQAYGDRAWYVHLVRDPDAAAASFVRRAGFGIMKAYREGILLDPEAPPDPEALARDYLATVDANIALFLKDKSHVMTVRLESASEDFQQFWDWIGARGDLDRALAEWTVRHNASPPP